MRITPGKIIRYVRNLPRIEKPLKYTVGLLLQATGVSRYLRIARAGYTIRFCPNSVLARSLWVSPRGRMREEQFVTRYLKSGDTLVDVGANIGTITFAGAAAVGAAGCVLSIEPHPRTFACLVENGTLNPFTNIRYYNGAVGASRGVVGFSDKGDDDQNVVKEDDGLQVAITTLDALLQEQGLASVDLLKIDVEGYEKHVLEGARRTLGITRCVYIETLDRNLRAFGTTTAEIVALLKAAGFHVCRVEGRPEEAVAVRDLDDLRDRMGDLLLTPVS